MMPRQTPYVGLIPYTEGDAGWFFGREHDERIIAANLRASRLTLLYGASGVGKTSVLLAGVVPRLREGIATYLAAPKGGSAIALAERPPFAITVFRDWRDAPLPRLAEAIRASVEEASGEAELEQWSGNAPLKAVLQGYTTRVRTLLVILDQFEEYFLYHPDERGPGTFAQEFPQVVNQVDLRVHFMISLREDAWAKLDRFKGAVPDLFGNYLRVDYLDREAAREAITKPVERYNGRLPAGEPPVTIAPELVEAVLDDVRTGQLALAEGSGGASKTADGADRIETPYLQLVMQSLWVTATHAGGHELSLGTLEELGGAVKIVSGHLSDAMDRLPPEDQEIAADVFGFLVTPSRTKIAQRSSDLAYWAKRPEPDTRRVLDELSGGERRILRALPPPPGELEVDRYEIFHDVLADAVLEWCGAQFQEREKAQLAEQVRAEEADRRKARRARILRGFAVVLGLLVVALVIVLIPALRARSQAKREQDRERSHSLAANAVAQLSVDQERALLLARESVRFKATRDAHDALASALTASQVRATLPTGQPRRCPACRIAARAKRWQPAPAALGEPFTFEGQGEHRIAFSPDRRTAAVVMHGRVRLWNLADGAARDVAGVLSATGVAFTADGRSMLISQEGGATALTPVAGRPRFRVVSTTGGAAVSRDRRYGLSFSSGERAGVVQVRRAGSDDVLAKLRLAEEEEFGGEPPIAQFSPRDSGLALVSSDRGALLWRWRSDRTQPLRVPSQRRGRRPAAFTFAEFSQSGDLIVGTNGNGRAHVWEAQRGIHRFSARHSNDRMSLPIVSADGKQMLTVADQAATIRSTSTGRALALFAGESDTISHAAFSPDGALVATAGSDGSVRIWDAASGQQLMELRGHSAPVVQVAFSPDGRFVLSAGEDGTARLWEVASAPVLRPELGVTAAAMSPDGRQVAVADEKGALRLWTPGIGKQRLLARIHRGIASVAFSPRGDLVAAGGGDPFYGKSKSKTAVVVNLDKNTVRRFSHDGLSDVAFDDAGKHLLTVSYERARLWDPYPPAPLSRVPAGEDTFTSGTFGRDGRILLMRDFESPRVFDPASEEYTDFKGEDPAASEDAGEFYSEFDTRRGDFSPDGRWVVTPAGRDAFVWDSRTGQVRTKLRGHTGRVNAAVFTADGRYIATAGGDRTVRVWEARTGRSLAILQSHADQVSDVEFTPSGREILSTGMDGTVRISPCYVCRSTDELRSLVASRITRDLTRDERLAFLGDSG